MWQYKNNPLGVSIEVNTIPQSYKSKPKPKHRFYAAIYHAQTVKPNRETKPKPKMRRSDKGDHIQSAFVCCWLNGLPIGPCKLLGNVALVGAPLTSPNPKVLIFFSGE